MDVFALDLNDTAQNPLAKFSSISQFVNVFIPVLNIGAALVFLAMFLYAAYTWLTAGDNPEQIKKAQRTFTFAIFGLIVVVTSYLAIKLIGMVFNVDLKL